MNMNKVLDKKLDRLKQWGKERMGNEARTLETDEFKSLAYEMTLRHEGMEKMQKSMDAYVKSMSKRKEADDKEKILPVDNMARAMIMHGDEFESDSAFGQCLIAMGGANEKIGRVQDAYVNKASSTWLESIERSVAQMKEYQVAKKKLEGRRLAYDATLSKMQKQKREDSRVEEELRAQRIKYEESSEEVRRRMLEIQEAEQDSVDDLGRFLDAEVEYFERCRDIMLQLKKNWPGRSESAARIPPGANRRTRSRANTAHSFSEDYREERPAPPPPPVDRPSIRSRVNSYDDRMDDRYQEHTSERRLPGGYRLPAAESRESLTPSKPTFARTNSASMVDTRAQGSTPMQRTPTDPPVLPSNRPFGQECLRQNPRPRLDTESVFSDPSDHDSQFYSSPDKSHNGSLSPATSIGSSAYKAPSRNSSNGNMNNSYVNGEPRTLGSRKAPPPPPPLASRGAKKPPPPPPMKRSQLSTGSIYN